MFLSRRKWALPVWVAFFMLYLAMVSALPTSIAMWQGYDDGLFVRLGRSIASGEWLGPYNELTLVKAPGYPMFLAVASWSGWPFNLAQYALHFVASLYLARVVARLCNAPSLGLAVFAVALLCPTYYAVTQVVREPLYGTLTLVIIAGWIDLFWCDRTRPRTAAMAVAVGMLTGYYWLFREEGVWILPSLIIILAGLSIWGDKVKLWSSFFTLTKVVIAFASVLVVLGLVNRLVYGDFVMVEMKDGDFQRAMSALQRVGLPFEKPYLPVPREARVRIYEESPSFARLRPFLDPTDAPHHMSQGSCGVLPMSCGDIGGGWFMWAFREAAAKAGMHSSPQVAANYYKAVATEIEAACAAKRLVCSVWLPPLIPAAPTTQWRKLPAMVLRAAMLLVYMPPPDLPPVQPSYLSVPDGADILDFLNRPYHFVGPKLLETKSNALKRAAADVILSNGIPVYRAITIIGLAGLFIALLLAFQQTLTDRCFVLVMALLATLLARCLLFASIEISSFPIIYPTRMLPAMPLAAVAAVLAGYLAARAVRARLRTYRGTPSARPPCY